MRPDTYKHIVKGFTHGSLLKVLLVGAGGNGSRILTGLATLDHAMRELGIGGLHVTVFDADTVSPSNVGRQTYYESDVGRSKAEVLVSRINALYRTNWRAIPSMLTEETELDTYWMVIGCVDTRKARRAIHYLSTQRAVTHGVSSPRFSYWLDLGNQDRFGQYILGEPQGSWAQSWPLRLPTVMDLWPGMLDPANDPVDDGPSCSMAEALEKQDLYVNQLLSSNALNLIWAMIRYGEIEFHGGFVNLRSGKAQSLELSIKQWAGMGYKCKRPQGPKARELAV